MARILLFNWNCCTIHRSNHLFSSACMITIATFCSCWVLIDIFIFNCTQFQINFCVCVIYTHFTIMIQANRNNNSFQIFKPLFYLKPSLRSENSDNVFGMAKPNVIYSRQARVNWVSVCYNWITIGYIGWLKRGNRFIWSGPNELNAREEISLQREESKENEGEQEFLTVKGSPYKQFHFVWELLFYIYLFRIFAMLMCVE